MIGWSGDKNFYKIVNKYFIKEGREIKKMKRNYKIKEEDNILRRSETKVVKEE